MKFLFVRDHFIGEVKSLSRGNLSFYSYERHCLHLYIYTYTGTACKKGEKGCKSNRQQYRTVCSTAFILMAFHRILSEDSKVVTTLWFYCAINTGAANYYQIDFPSNGCSPKQPEQRQKWCLKVLHTLISCLQLINSFNEKLFKACSWTILLIRQSQHIMKQM